MAFALAMPEDLQFSDLKLTFDARSGTVTLDHLVLQRLCETNGLQLADIDAGDLLRLLEAWYAMHRALSGAPDAAYERISALARAPAPGQPVTLVDGRVVRHLH